MNFHIFTIIRMKIVAQNLLQFFSGLDEASQKLSYETFPEPERGTLYFESR